jgi:hypothetical protein
MGPHYTLGKHIRPPAGAGRTPLTRTRHYAMSLQAPL